MVAQATDAAGEVLMIQQVYLMAEGNKAPVNPVKRTNKAAEGWSERSAVRLPGREPLVLCEGVETSLSVWQASGQEVWACLGVSNIDRAPVPEKATVIIACDGDAPGSKAEGTFVYASAALHGLISMGMRLKEEVYTKTLADCSTCDVTTAAVIQSNWIR